MITTTRILNFLFFAAMAIAISACASPAVTECGATGVLCPKGFHCAAAQGICISDARTCGDAHTDTGEACDDGNTVDGDGCSADCLSDETCGNNKIDTTVGEDCDDGPSKLVNGKPVGGDGCSDMCKTEGCGNRRKDVGEVCDDGNDIEGDGCSHACTSLEFCGNSIKDIGEACDPPDGITCNANCSSTLKCNNGVVDTDLAEECDVLGLDEDDNDCRSDCIVNRCGDGYRNLNGSPGHLENIEECDDAPKIRDVVPPRDPRSLTPTETQTCNVDCTIPSCGDGKINHAFTPDQALGPEQCDPPSPGNGCSATCQFEKCGNGITDPPEECDDGNSTNGDACDTNCTTPKCGNRIVDPNEGCDDGNTNDNDGCSGVTCVIEFCGDTKTNNNLPVIHEVCDTGVASQSCDVDCTAPSCGDGVVNHAFTPLNALGPEQCDPPSPANGCSNKCQFERCGNGITDPPEECDDGNTTDGDACDTNCTTPKCGNNIVDPGERCDDGNTVSNDGCSGVTCAIEFCGDGTPNNNIPVIHETCDGGGATQACDADCTAPSCGDGVVNHAFTPLNALGPEQCDPPAPGNGCSAKCQFESCGNGITDPPEACDDGDAINGDECDTNCTLPACGNGIVDPIEGCDDGNTASNDGCSGTTCAIEFCGDGTTNNNIPVVHEICDTRVATQACDADCTAPSCGDGVVNPAFKKVGATEFEQCDPPTPGDGCSAFCQFEICGNGIQDVGEDCDDGNPTNGDACDTDCKAPRCGNGLPDPTEVCDDGNTSNTDACTTLCRNAVCGDGFVRTGTEVCDDGNTTCGTCSGSCQAVTAATPATGLIFAAAAADLAAGQTFTINDGFTPQVVFTFFVTGPAPSHGIRFDPADPTDNNASMADKIINAVNGAGLLIDAVRLPSTSFVLLTHRMPSVNGVRQITETVTNANFGVFGMQGGLAGDCDTGTNCAFNGDCETNRCAANKCAKCLLNTDCTSRLCEPISGRCEVCVLDGDCGPLRTCNNGVCVGP